MYFFSENSKRNLSECDEKLQRIGYVVIKIIDVSCVEGFRNKKNQNKAYKEKLSKLKWDKSEHNKKPSKAFHLLPYPGGWEATREEFVYMAGIVLGVAIALEIPIRWGGDWNSDDILDDWDLAHFELI